MALVVDTDDALRPRRLAVGAGEPAAGFLDPEQGITSVRAQAVFDAVGRALGAMDRWMGRRRKNDRLVADRAVRLDQARELGAARQRRLWKVGKNHAGV